MWGFLLETATVPRPEITEWAPTPLLTLEGAVYLVLLGLSGAAILRKAPPPGAPLIAVYAIVAVLPLMAMRHLPLFALSALVIGAAPLAALSRRWSPGRDRAARPVPPWFHAALVAGGLAAAALSVPYLRGPVIDGDQHPFPVRAVGLLEASGVTGDMAIYFDWGEYAIWHLAPDIRVSWDGRRETVYGTEAYAANLNFLFGIRDWDRLLTEHGTDLALVSPRTPVYNLLKLNEPWTVVYEDSLAAIFAPESSPQARRLRLTPPPDVSVDGEGLFFP